MDFLTKKAAQNEIPIEAKKKLIYQAQKIIAELEIDIDLKQKELAKLRATIPQKCNELYIQEKSELLQYYVEGELKPEIMASSPVDVEHLKMEIQQKLIEHKNRIENNEKLEEILKKTVNENLELEQLIAAKVDLLKSGKF